MSLTPLITEWAQGLKILSSEILGLPEENLDKNAYKNVFLVKITVFALCSEPINQTPLLTEWAQGLKSKLLAHSVGGGFYCK